ncbi:glycerophosphodiester phosphodiesterase [Devosia riboflavina]|uniref:Glycerophosphodiester phosphodiesterase n=1 Tax=Devosia riboflavina TaxID=46914 RepID=A0A087M6V2_9HYPH|nr:glycerophosphodiester phosphodiesterase family protein [Devosia riboflavina]KFL32605.1 glycerophosphodiester phosphodiesterase [Devosia riboflavina]
MTRIASHRGGTLEFGDSTPTGFRKTAQMALEEVEFDVHPTRDGAIMVHHDATLERTTDKTGAIATLSEAEVRAATINYSGGEHPLSLDELCDIYRDSTVEFRCEIKPDAEGRAYSNFVPGVVDTLRKGGMRERTRFSSFLLDTLVELGAVTQRPCLWLVSPQVLRLVGRTALFEIVRARSISEIGVHIDEADAELMAAANDAGIAFGCWAAHTAEQIEKALGLGIKVFTTDRPSLAIALRDNRAGRQPA